MTSSSETTVKMLHSKFTKHDRSDSTNYLWWRDKMMFLLIALKIAYVLNLDLSSDTSSLINKDTTSKKERKKLKNDEVFYRGHILNSLSDQLYNLVSPLESIHEIWRTLEDHHQTLKQGTNKFFISKFLL